MFGFCKEFWRPINLKFNNVAAIGKIDAFEDLECWKAARELVRLVNNACKCGTLARDFDMRSQLRRAALSTMNNIAQGFGRESIREMIRFFDISQSSAMEVKSIMYSIFDMKSLPDANVEIIQRQAEKTKSLTRGFMRYLKTKLQQFVARRTSALRTFIP